MFTFILPVLFSLLLLLFTTTVAQPYKATEHFLLDCGSSTPNSTSNANEIWDGDENSKFVPSDITTTSFSFEASSQDPLVDTIPYSTARFFNTSSFTYTFTVSQGHKFLRLHFYPTTYSNLHANQSFFSVSSNGYALLTNFSAFLHVLFQEETRPDAKVLVKEFLIHVNDTQTLNVVFTPSPNSYAFINGIEIVSMPDNLYFNNAIKPKPVGMTTGPIIDNYTALENIYRLNMGGEQISGKYDTGMYRFWDKDNNYIYSAARGLTPFNTTPITYTPETPNYTAPEQVYETQRSMGNLSERYNLTWILPVDSGFFYMLRLHFCNIIPQYTKERQVLFMIFINNQTAEERADLFYWTQGSGYPFFKDYAVFANSPDGRPRKQDLWLALHPNKFSEAYLDAYLNGLEVFKLNMNGNLSSPNPEVSPAQPLPNLVPSIKGDMKNPPYARIIGGVGGGIVFFMFILVLIYLRQRKQIKLISTR